MFVTEFSTSEQIRLVHSYIYSSRRKTFREGLKYMFYQTIRPFVSDEKNIVNIIYFFIFPVSKNSFYVRQYLYTRYQLNRPTLCISINFIQLVFCILPAQIAKHRLFFHLIRIFRIKL